MEAYSTLVTSKSTGNEADHKALIKEISRTEWEERVLGAHISQLENVLQSFDVAKHTLGCIQIMAARLRNKEGSERSITNALILLNGFDPAQARLWPVKFTEFCQNFTDLLVETNQSIRGIASLLKAITSLQPTPHHITSLHAMVVQLALLAKCHHLVRDLLDQPITKVSVECTGIGAESVLKYYYYGGMIYAGVVNFPAAQDFFMASMCVPAQVTSCIALEAFKKYILTSLLADNHLNILPTYIPVVVLRQAKILCKLYMDFAQVYSKHNVAELKRFLTTHEDVFMRDVNLGLANQCVESLHRHNIQRLTRTFMTLSLADIAEHVKLESPLEAERYILKMIENGEIHAKIDQKDGMVVFTENPDNYNTTHTMHNIDTQIRSTITVNEKVSEVDAAMSKMEAYLSKVIQAERSSNTYSTTHLAEEGRFDQYSKFKL